MEAQKTSPADGSGSAPEVSFEATQEIRFATVMYGGVSLAVYMNGVSQELLSAVRATAPRERGNQRSGKALKSEVIGTEEIYRQLGCALYHGRKPGTPLERENKAIRTRIVVDILAGTSAGGINAVYLAKALVNDVTLEPLRDMWLSKADIDTLLNDNGSRPGRFPPTNPLTSLLNSTRMYGLLHDAFDRMDAEKAEGAKALVNDLDLFVTTTDLNGVITPIQLADKTVEERIYKASFHFVHGRALDSNDFTQEDNPMLAFAARCTSSFPVAFEPMKIVNLNLLDERLVDRLTGERFQKFFAFFKRNDRDLPYPHRPLADGGYLNNKPFSFVIDEIPSRTAAVPVRRKLLYLDPEPETAKDFDNIRRNIDFVQNLLDAASTLPREQNIREDIERLNEYNRTIHAAQAIAAEIEDEAGPHSVQQCLEQSAKTTSSYENRTLKEMQDQYGRCYATYHRLRVAAVTSDLAQLVTRLQYSDRSDYLYAIRMLIIAWRRDKYSANGGPDKKTENYFLYRYDIGFRFRRADYVRGCVDRLLGALAAGDAQKLQETLRSAAADPEADARQLRVHLPAAREELYRWRDRMETIKCKLSWGRDKFLLASSGHSLPVAGSEHGFNEDLNRQRDELLEFVRASGITQKDLDNILRPVLDADCQLQASAIYNDKDRSQVSENIGKAGEVLADWYGALLKESEPGLTRELKGYSEVKPPVARIVQRYVAVHFEYFDCRDMQIFTAVQDQLAGEGVEVEIYRVSPLDSTRLRTASDPEGADKLAGTALYAFGAFMSKAWRENDMMWGRLDGAERIITALLPDPEDDRLRDEYCTRAFQAILRDQFSLHGCGDLMRQIIAYLRKTLADSNIDPDNLSPDEFLRLSMREAGDCCSPLIRRLLKAISDDADRMTMFRAYYMKPTEPPVKESLERLRRALRIFTAMLKGLDGGEGASSKIVGRAATLAAAVTRFAEFSVPQKMPNAFLRYWMQALYAIGGVLVAVGALFSNQTESAGWTVLGITALANIVSAFIGRGLRGRRITGQIVAIAAIVLLMFAAIAAGFERYHCYFPPEAWRSPLHSLSDGYKRHWDGDYCDGWGRYR